MPDERGYLTEDEWKQIDRIATFCGGALTSEAFGPSAVVLPDGRKFKPQEEFFCNGDVWRTVIWPAMIKLRNRRIMVSWADKLIEIARSHSFLHDGNRLSNEKDLYFLAFVFNSTIEDKWEALAAVLDDMASELLEVGMRRTAAGNNEQKSNYNQRK